MPEAINLDLSRSRVPDGPYPGLRPFEPHEWSIFFGREVMAAEVIAKLGEQNLIIVHGSSGCGKSSLVRAGILPALQSDHDLNRQDFRYSIIRPSQGPLDALAAALLAQLGPANGKDLEESWLDRIAVERDLVETIERRLDAGNATFCLVVDQFEEIFRWAEERDRAEAEYLVDFMTAVAKRDAGNRNFFILVTMRSDYLGQCAQFNGFAGVVNQCQYLLDNLDEFGILRAIHEPADRFGGSVDPALADRLRFMAKDDADALPILQHTLMRMYDALPGHEPGWTLGLSRLAEASGEHGALSEHAETIYQETVAASPERAVALEWMFRALTDLDAGGRAIRRPCRLGELVAVSCTDEATVRNLVDAFARPGRNFLVIAASARGGEEIDISHEALIRRWRRLGDNSVDADTGQRSGWVFREFQAGLIWKALAVFANRGETALDAETTRQWLPFFEQVERRPAWAARYFVDPLPGVAPEEQPEWKRVMALIAASRARLERDSRAARRTLVRSWILLGIGLAVFVLVGAFVLDAMGRAQSSRKLADESISRSLQDRARANRATTDARQLTDWANRQRHDADNARRIAAASIARTQARASAIIAGAAAREASAERRAAAREASAERRVADLNDRAGRMQTALLLFGAANRIQVLDSSAEAEEWLVSLEARYPPVALPSDFRTGLQSLLTEMGVPVDRAEPWAEQIERHRAAYELTTERRLAAFVAAAALATNGFTSFEEQLDFATAEAVRQRFPEISGEQAANFVHRPRELANFVYAPPGPEARNLGVGEPGTGNTEADDGWTYRGRGLIFTRGRSDYDSTGATLEENLLASPDLVNDPRFIVRAALERWFRRRGNERADAQNFVSIARRVLGINNDPERLFALEERARRLIAQALERARRDR